MNVYSVTNGYKKRKMANGKMKRNNMSFAEAMDALSKGYKVRQDSWEKSIYYFIIRGKLCLFCNDEIYDENPNILQCEIEGNNWEITNIGWSLCDKKYFSPVNIGNGVTTGGCYIESDVRKAVYLCKKKIKDGEDALDVIKIVFGNL